MIGKSPNSVYINSNHIGIPFIQGHSDLLNQNTHLKKYTTKPIKTANAEDILMTVRAPVGKIYTVNTPICCGRGVCILKTNSFCLKEFLFHLLVKHEEDWKSIEKGSTFKSINRDDIRNFQIYLPFIDEQKKIIHFLGLIDKYAGLHRKHLQLFKLYTRGYINGVLNQKIKLNNKVFNFKPWQTTTLEKLGFFLRGLTSKSKDDFANGTESFITYMNVYKNRFANEEEVGLVRINNNEKQNRIQYGDILFTQSSENRSEVGMSSVWLNDSSPFLNSFCIALRPYSLEEINPIFIGYLMRSDYVRTQIMRNGQGTSRINLSSTKLKKINIVLPSLDEQQKLAQIFIKLESLEKKYEQELNSLQKIKKALLQLLFI